MTIKRIFALLSMSGFLSLATANELEANLSAQQGELDQAKDSQIKIDKLYEQKLEVIQDTREAKAEIEQLTVYNRQLTSIIRDQVEQMASLEEQIQNIEVTQQGIMPLMERMLSTLDQFISLDTPFLLEERQERVANLRGLLLSSKVTISEKFRRVLEAFQIEIEYGRTIEAYRGKDAQGNVVDFLRVGRVGLYALDLDESKVRIWNRSAAVWEELEDRYTSAIEKGIKIARKQSAPSLLDLKLPGLKG